MTFVGSSNHWLNLSGNEPDLYYHSAESALSGSLRTPEEETDPHFRVIRQLSHLAINDAQTEEYHGQERASTHPVWATDMALADDGLSTPPKQFTTAGLYDPQLPLSQCGGMTSFYEPGSINLSSVCEQDLHIPLEEIQAPFNQLPVSAGALSYRPVGRQPPPTQVNHLRCHETKDDYFDWQIEQATVEQEKLMSALRKLRNDVRYVREEIDDLECDQSEYAEDVAEALQGKPSRWLPLN